MENKNFSVECCLLAFCIVALGPPVSLDLFAYKAYIIFFLVRVFFKDAIALLRESYTFLYRRSYFSSINLVKLMFLEFDE